MITPTSDVKLRERLIQMFNNANKYWEWTDSQALFERRQKIIVEEILREFEIRGYHIG